MTVPPGDMLPAVRLAQQLGLQGLARMCDQAERDATHEAASSSPSLRVQFHCAWPEGRQPAADWATSLGALGLAPSATLRMRELH